MEAYIPSRQISAAAYAKLPAHERAKFSKEERAFLLEEREETEKPLGGVIRGVEK